MRGMKRRNEERERGWWCGRGEEVGMTRKGRTIDNKSKGGET